MEFKEVIRNRFACKVYAERKVSREALHNILEAGRLAPTAKDLQEYHVYVIESDEGLKVIDNCSPCRYKAPTVLAVTCDRTNTYVYPDGSQESGAEDISIVATHMMLAAQDEGLNTCWVNCFQSTKLHEELGLPENEQIILLMDVGYAGEGGVPLANHFRRKTLEETVTYR